MSQHRPTRVGQKRSTVMVMVQVWCNSRKFNLFHKLGFLTYKNDQNLILIIIMVKIIYTWKGVEKRGKISNDNSNHSMQHLNISDQEWHNHIDLILCLLFIQKYSEHVQNRRVIFKFIYSFFTNFTFRLLYRFSSLIIGTQIDHGWEKCSILSFLPGGVLKLFFDGGVRPEVWNPNPYLRIFSPSKNGWIDGGFFPKFFANQDPFLRVFLPQNLLF